MQSGVGHVAAVLLALMISPVAAQTPLVNPPVVPLAPKTYATVRVTLTTSLGPIIVELEKERAPITAANFLRYVDQKRYDGVTFYRRSRSEERRVGKECGIAC